jgi:hypothetical protein
VIKSLKLYLVPPHPGANVVASGTKPLTVHFSSRGIRGTAYRYQRRIRPNWSNFMHLTYHVHVHDGGWAYRLGDVWSETYPTHDAALRAARDAAKRQQIGGEDAQISYETADGTWHQESVRGSDRPEVDVEDDAKT